MINSQRHYKITWEMICFYDKYHLPVLLNSLTFESCY